MSLKLLSNLDYLHLDYPDYLIIGTFFSGPVFHEYHEVWWDVFEVNKHAWTL